MKVFSTIWFGQLVSTVGSGLTGFALGLWIYQETGSTTQFALFLLCFTIPTLIISPVAGVLVDRVDRKWIMLLSDVGAVISTLIVWLLYINGSLAVWHIYIASIVNAAFTSFQWPAYSAATTMLVPKEQLGRAAGMVQIGEAISQLASPAIAGAMFMVSGLKTIMMIDIVTCTFAILLLLVVSIPKPEESKVGKESKGSFIKEATFGLKYIARRPGLLGLMVYYLIVNFVFVMINPLLMPMMMDIASPDKVGYTVSVMGVGMMAGTLVMSAWGGPKRRVLGIFIPAILLGFSVSILGLSLDLPVIAAGGFFTMFLLPILNASSQAIWQTKVEPDVQGRVFAARRMFSISAQPIGLLLAGPLADQIFEPLMMEGGRLAAVLGPILGTGPGRGTGLLLIMIGLLTSVASVVAFTYPRIRNVEDELPDVIAAPDEPQEMEPVAKEAQPVPA